MSTYQHFLVATDLSKENHLVFEKAVAMAKLFGAQLSVLHVLEPLPGYGYAYVGIAEIEAELYREAEKSMQKLAEKYAIPKTHCHLKIGSTKMELNAVIRSEAIDCVILGSHGRHGIAELLGSTAHAAVHTAVCDVLTVRI